jgi:hypothetical protein
MSCIILLSGATAVTYLWSIDFMQDRLMGDRRQPFPILTVVDIVTRKCLALEVAPRFQAGSVIHVLSRVVQQRGTPVAIRCNQGRNSPRRRSTSGRTRTRSSSTFRAQASRRTMPLSSHSMPAYERSCSTRGGLVVSKKPVGRRGRGGASTTRIDGTDHCSTKRRKPSRHLKKRHEASKITVSTGLAYGALPQY